MIQPTAIDRAMTAFRALVKSVFPALVYFVPHEYTVAESDGLTFSGTPTDATFSPVLPTRIPYSPALAGSSCVVPVGTLAYVAFANADPSKPFLVRFGAGATSVKTTIDATDRIRLGTTIDDGARSAARVGDQCGRLAFFPGVPGTTPPSLWYSYSNGAPYVWAQVDTTIITGPSPSDAGKVVKIETGSTKVVIVND